MAWQAVIEGSDVWVYEYSVNRYSQINAFAVLLDEKTLAVVSPPTGMSDKDFAAIDQKGRVTALIAPHSGHDLGQAEWQARYPEAQPYAPSTALNQLNAPGLRPFAPLSKLSSSSSVEFREVPGTKKGGTLVIVRRGKRPVVYLDELVGNWASLPGPFLVKLLFWLTGSAPGLKINQVYLKILCSNKQAVAQTVLNALEDDPMIVLAHGTPLTNKGDIARVRTLVESVVG
ncbi:hypothetical protein VB735_19450 [Halotia wernerae UHCC 0503]|nr:hypothetical protein [Halotia wernerae UHCC 0503]